MQHVHNVIYDRCTLQHPLGCVGWPGRASCAKGLQVL